MKRLQGTSIGKIIKNKTMAVSIKVCNFKTGSSAEAVKNYLKNIPDDLLGKVDLANSATPLSKDKVFIVLHKG